MARPSIRNPPPPPPPPPFLPVAIPLPFVKVKSGHYVPVKPTPLREPRLIIHSPAMAAELGISEEEVKTPRFAAFFSGDMDQVRPSPMHPTLQRFPAPSPCLSFNAYLAEVSPPIDRLRGSSHGQHHMRSASWGSGITPTALLGTGTAMGTAEQLLWAK